MKDHFKNNIMKKHLLLFFILVLYFTTKAQYQKFSDAKNAYGFLYTANNCLTYNSDLNVLAFTQRLTNAWPNSAFPFTPNPAGATGYLVTKYSSDGGATWDSLCYYQNDVHWPRYPGGAIFNPPGNTQPSNAYAVGFGPTTSSTSSTTGWDGMYFGSAQLNAALSTIPGMHTQTTNDQQWFPMTGLNGTDSVYMIPASPAVAGNTIWICAQTIKSNFTNTGFALIKGSYTGSGFSWTVDTVFKNLWVLNHSNDPYIGNPQIAFQPGNPMVGYLLVTGVDSLDTTPYGKMTYTPMVWKTIDGGANWNRVNMNYDWLTGGSFGYVVFANLHHPAFWQTYPSFTNIFGGDITVDANGILHYITSCTPPYSYHRDSLSFLGTFGYDSTGHCNVPYVIHLTTDGNGTWSKRILDELHSRWMPASDSYNPWRFPAGSGLAYGNRIQVSRNGDGTRLFFSWIDTKEQDATINPLIPNDKPSLKAVGYNATNAKYSGVKEISKNETNANGFWWMNASDVVIENSGNYTIPVVYASQNVSGNFNSTLKTDLYYVNDLDFNDSEINWLPYIPFSLFDPYDCVFIDPPPWQNSLKEEGKNLFGKIYPNPATNQLTIELKDAAKESCTISIYSITGQALKKLAIKHAQETINVPVSDLSAGMYILEIEAAEGKERVKIIKE
jgi:hypothetical protein